MKRLTKQWGNNPAVPTEFDIDCAFDMDNETWAKLCEIFNRLAAYEDSGLSPEEVLEPMHLWEPGGESGPPKTT
jgi:hypothetical protein